MKNNCKEAFVYAKKGLLDCKAHKNFWITWNAGLLRVGTGYSVGKNQIMQTKLIR